jgi:dihydrofolate synthase/folylpolyglutamate synthase
MDYQQALGFLFSLERFGIKLGLGNTLSLLSRLDNPHIKFASIHVAGTNGKGSCAAMLHSVLNRAGYVSGLYTSPHLLDFSERIKANDCPIEKEFVTDFISGLKDEIIRNGYTFFEVTTALAFYYFAYKKVEIAVVETGLGGRLDSTNVILPEVAIITNIGLEHTSILGKTLKEIAQEKGGIIKKDVPVITAIRKEKPYKVIETLCREKNSELVSVFEASSWKIRRSSPEGVEFDLSTRDNSYPGVQLRLSGEHQVQNAACAILALEKLNHRYAKVDRDSILTGLSQTRWRGRLEVYRDKPLVVLDVAHNPEGTRSLVKALRRLFPDKKINFIFGVLEDKDYKKMLQILSGIARQIILVQVRYHRGAKIELLVKTAQMLGLKFKAISDINNACECILRNMNEEEMLCITGSHFTVGEFLKGQQMKF